jgi:hypothetical protein
MKITALAQGVFIGVVAALGWSSWATAASITTIASIPNGTVVDLSGLALRTPLSATEQAFRDAGIESITPQRVGTATDSRYNTGYWDNGRALFVSVEGDLIAQEAGSGTRFGRGNFTIVFDAPILEFGLAFPDTNSSWSQPQLDFKLDGNLVASTTISGRYDPTDFFGFALDMPFDEVFINTLAGGQDGVGINDITVGQAVAPIPLPAGGVLLISGLVALAARKRRG